MSWIVNTTKNRPIARDTAFATSVWSRFKGLMLRREDDFGDGKALVIDPCTSIHMFFMRFPIDVLYLNKDNEVVRVQRGLRPWRLGPLYTKGARFVVELPVGAAEESQTVVGDVVSIGAPATR